MAKVLVVAPHPDDETLGCGGTLLRHIAEGDEVHWLIATTGTTELGFSEERIAARSQEINTVASSYGFASTHKLGLPTTLLDTLAKREMVQHFGGVFHAVKPEICYLPNPTDAHSDHQACFDAAMASCKWFRGSAVRQVLVYETLSETGFRPSPGVPAFAANHYVNIAPYLDKKIAMMQHYSGEMQPFPFPRSEEAIRALAALRGTEIGATAAEAFQLLKQVR